MFQRIFDFLGREPSPTRRAPEAGRGHNDGRISEEVSGFDRAQRALLCDASSAFRGWGQIKSRVEVFFIDCPRAQRNRELADSSTRPLAWPNLFLRVDDMPHFACKGVRKR